MNLKMLGSITLALILIAVPCITILSFVLNWYPFFKTILVALSIADIIVLAEYIYEGEPE